MKLGVAERHKEGEKQKPTRHFSDRQEKAVAKATGGRQVANSGAGWVKGDVLTDGGLNTFLLEAKTKTTHAESIGIKKEWFDKNKKECIETGKQHSAIVFNFGPDEENHYIIDEYLFVYLQQKLAEEKEAI